VEQSAWIEMWARRIKALPLSSVALPLIEIACPFSLLGSHIFFMAQPLMTGAVDDATLEQISALLDDPELLERLKVYLEEEESQT